MKFNFSLIFTLFLSFVLANEQDDCTEIRNYMDRNLLGRGNILGCAVNDDGEVTHLKIGAFLISEEEVDKLFSYNTLKVLEFENNFVVENGAKPFNYSSFVLDHLTNLEELNIASYDTKFNMETFNLEVERKIFDNLKLPKSLKKLELTGIQFNQNDIDEISTLTNLEELSLSFCNYEELNLDSFENLSKISSLTLSESMQFEVPESAKTDILKVLKPLKKLNMMGVILSQANIDDIATLSNLENLSLQFKNVKDLNFSSLKKLTNLHYLKLDKAVYSSPDPDLSTDFIGNLSNLKNLTIITISINQDNIKEINNLVNLESLDIYLPENIFIDNMTLDNLSNLTNLMIYSGSQSNIIVNLPYSENLKKLDLINVKTTQKLIDDISKLTSLEELFFFGANFKEFDYDKLDSLNNLIDLSISSDFNNKLTEIPPFVFNLKSLKKLTMMNEYIETISDDIANLKELEELNLSFNGISVIPEALTSLKNLKTLDLNNNRLTSIPSGISNNENLEELILNNNYIMELPDEICSLKKLKNINLNYNQISSLPDNFFNLTEIEILKLDNNQIKTISDSIGNLKKLKEISIQRNECTSIPSGLMKCENLIRLNFNSNKITSFPTEIGNLKKLDELVLANNKIKGKLPETLNDLTNLRIFDVSYNEEIEGTLLTVSTLELCSYGFSSNLCMTKETLCTDMRYKRCDGEDYQYLDKAPVVGGPSFEEIPPWYENVPTSTEIIPTSTVIPTPTQSNETNEIQCLAELIGYSCCRPELTDVYSQDEYGDWGYDFETNEWCGLTPYQETSSEECWSESLGYSCCKGCGVMEIDKYGSWGYENNKWCGVPTSC